MRLRYFLAVSCAAACPFAFCADDAEAAGEKPAKAAEAAEAASAEPETDPALEAEIAYVEALVNNGYPDYAAPIIEATKKKWPESEVRFFAIEIRGLLSMGKFDEAEKKIAALPDRNGTKFWAARLEVANSYFSRNQKDECMKIYDEFFKKYPDPPKELREFHKNACYTYGYLLKTTGDFKRATEIYEALMKRVKDDVWCDLASDVAEMHLKVASDEKKKKNKGAFEAELTAATKIAERLLWRLDQPVFFGKGISLKAHCEQMRGNIDGATKFIEEYKPQLQELHDQIVEADPDNSKGFLKLSPLPECLFLEARIQWDAAKEEYKKPKRDDERVKALMFGAKEKGSSKRGDNGAFKIATKIFLNYEASPWAAEAGEMTEEIRAFAEKNYGAKIKTKITKEQIAKMRVRQFKGADEKFANGQYPEAIAEYYAALKKNPERAESVRAVANIVHALLDMVVEEKDEEKKAEYRDDADAIEGYLAERFAGHPDKVVMSDAGNAVIGIAAKEAERHENARADWLYTEFIVNYRNHANAPTLALGKGMEALKAERWSDAIKFFGLLEAHYTNSTHYASALAQLSYCYGKLGDPTNEIAYINKYLPIEKVEIRRLQAKMQLAQMYQKDGLRIQAALNELGTNAPPERVEADEKHGSAQIIRALQQFTGFSKEAQKAIDDPGTTKDDVEKYKFLREAALYLVGDCWCRLTRPAAKLTMFRERAAQSYEAYLKDYPDGKYSKVAYVKLGTIYTALGQMEKTKDALDRLSKAFPDSDEAKNAMPRLAKSLIEMGMKKEGTEIYKKMLDAGGTYTAGQFLNAGDALIEAKSWELSNRAFEQAIKLAGTNSAVTVARARLGLARSAYKQGSLAEAREALDLFLSDPKMAKMAIAADANFLLVEVAKEQGRTEKDATMRGKYFGAAVGALKKVRTYWAKKPQEEQDTLDLLSGDVLVDRMKAEEAMGLKDEAKETCGRAASTFQVFLQSHGVTAEHPLEKMKPGEVANLERCYETMIPLFSKMGGEQADRVMKFGEEYLRLFPNGKGHTTIANCMNQAKADLPNGAAAKPAAEEKASEPADDEPAAEEKSEDEKKSEAKAEAEEKSEAKAEDVKQEAGDSSGEKKAEDAKPEDASGD